MADEVYTRPNEYGGFDYVYSDGTVSTRRNGQIVGASKNTSPLVGDSSEDAIQNLANRLNVTLSDTTKDSLLQYYLNSSLEKEKWDRQLDYAKNQYQYAIKDMVKAGINPVQAFGALSGSNPGTTSSNLSKNNSQELRLERDRINASTATSIIGVLGIIAAAIVHAL